MKLHANLLYLTVLGVLVNLATSFTTNASPTVDEALSLQPVQKSVAYDIPPKSETKNCNLVQAGGVSGWILVDPAGRRMRKFLDTDGDKRLDQWCYYKDGVEIYRDIDSDKNGRADQYRWLGTAGTRWGIDKNEDGTIERWKAISPEEVSSEVIEALKTKDVKRFASLLLTPAELVALGLDSTRIKRIQDLKKSALKTFSSTTRGKRQLAKNAKWINFSATRPGIVAAGEDGLTKDVVVYENAVAMYEEGGQHHQIFLGTLIQVTDGWRLVQAPATLSADQNTASAGLFFTSRPRQPGSFQSQNNELAEKNQKLLDELEGLDKELNAANTSKQISSLNARRAEILEMIIDGTEDKTQRTNWIRQLADTLSASSQSGDYPDGAKQLERLIKRLESSGADVDQVPYAKFRYLSADYTLSLQDPKAIFSKVQEKWLNDLEEYVNEYPKSQDTAEAMLQLAIAEEFAGQEDKAKNWYTRIIKTSGATLLAKKAAGAKRRLESVGKPLELVGRTVQGKPVKLSSYKGKVVVLHYWATWCEPCLEDMKRLKKLQARYGSKGFIPIGINLDSQKRAVSTFLQSNRYPWPQLHEMGGLDSRLANELGVLTLPTMLLVDQKGKVANRGLHVGELDDILDTMLK